MKKQVLKLLRLAKNEGYTAARDTLDCIKKSGMMDEAMVCTGSCYEMTYFKWGHIVVHYNGITEEITVYVDGYCWSM